MPELPEITVLSQQMDKELVGKRVDSVEVKQPKNLNMPVADFSKTIAGKTVEDVSSRGKWLFVKMKPDHYLLINLGMGAEILYFKKGQKLPDNYHFRTVFSDQTGFTIHFWWFGYVHLVAKKDLPKHTMTGKLGKSATDKAFTLEHLNMLFEGKKGSLKSFLLDQKNIAGIGNVYAQDILFRAGLHPNRKISTLSKQEISGLYGAILETLNQSIKLGGAAFERDFYGNRGGFTAADFLVGYKQGKPCPECGTTIEKVKTGSTSSYVCPSCQK
jgi:formamidopyrimidine-DNA glycosylase